MQKMAIHKKLVNTDWHQLLNKTEQLVKVSFILRNSFLRLPDLLNVERRFFAEILKAMSPLYRNQPIDLLLIWYNWLQIN